mgnify:CR=1 FL=1
MDAKIISLSVMLLAQAAGVVWWASSLSAEVQHNNYQIKMMSRDVEKNSNFVELWPAGKWGSGELPSDTRQDLKIERLEKQIESIIDKVYGNGP